MILACISKYHGSMYQMVSMVHKNSNRQNRNCMILACISKYHGSMYQMVSMVHKNSNRQNRNCMILACISKYHGSMYEMVSMVHKNSNRHVTLVKVLCYSVNKFKCRKWRRMIGSKAVLTTVKKLWVEKWL